MSQFGWARTYERGGPDAPQGAFEGDGMIECLPNGSAPARGFASDLAEVIDVAKSVPPLAGVDPASLGPAEVAVQVYVIRLRNGGCGACGGYQMSALPSITWDDADDSATTRTGTIVARDDPDDAGAEHEIPFSVSYTPAEGWTVSINAC
ncbi:MAG: hypothetical protein HGA44_12640 [Cellulomonadaceae bacterium]|nr:hypothetical protein [Cellulomonadaceae bacterium]